MEQEQVEKFRKWFDEYAAGFYGDDEYINANLKLKEDHTRRTCEEMMYLADELGLDDSQKRLAEVIALFHDIGRFKQFIEYRTYNDVKSVNHCLFALEVLREEKVLDGLGEGERELIEEAIEYHGLKELPGGLDGDGLLLSKLLRDADKLDIYYVVTEGYKRYRYNPEEFLLELEFPDESEYSREIVESILAGEQIHYGRLRTWNDMRLLQLAWVYNVNFAATLRRIKQRRYIETVIGFLPDTEDIRKAGQKVLGYLDAGIEQEKCR